MTHYDIDRAAAVPDDPPSTAATRTVESLGMVYGDCPWPTFQWTHRRAASVARRCTTGWPRAGAHFGRQRLGGPDWYAAPDTAPQHGTELTWGRATWFGRGRPSTAPSARA